MRRITSLLTVAVVLLCGASLVAAQESFTSDDYTMEFPSQTWKTVPRSNGVHQYAEFINGERNDGYLRVRKDMLDSDVDLTEMARGEQDMKLRYLPGFVGGKSESFAGRLDGIVSTYEYTSGGKPMTGLIYYLKADNRTIYVLHFTGRSDRLARIRNQTDSIARSFNLKR